MTEERFVVVVLSIPSRCCHMRLDEGGEEEVNRSGGGRGRLRVVVGLGIIIAILISKLSGGIENRQHRSLR